MCRLHRLRRAASRSSASGSATSSGPGRSSRSRSPRTSSSSRSESVVRSRPSKIDLAADDAGRRLRDEAHDRERRHGLAAARLADDAERPARARPTKLTPSTAWTSPSRVKKCVRRSSTSRSATHVSLVRGSSASRRPSAMKMAQRMSHAIATRGDDDDVRVRAVRAVAVLRHRAPGGVRRVDPEADEREERLAEDHAGQLEEDERRSSTPSVFGSRWRNEDAVPARADRVRRAHVVVLLQRDDLAAHDARRREPRGDRQRDDHRPEVDRRRRSRA